MKHDHMTTIGSLTYSISEEARAELLGGYGAATLCLASPLTEELERLRHSLLEEKKTGMVASPTIGDIYQHFYQKVTFADQALLEALAQKVGEVIDELIYRPASIPGGPPVFDSRVIQHYKANDSPHLYGIPPHRDHRAFVGVVVIMLLEGESLFHVAKDKECNGEVHLPAKPLDIIVMRGYDFLGEDKRPVHYVKKVTEKTGRTTLSFRTFSKNEEHLEVMRKAFEGKY